MAAIDLGGGSVQMAYAMNAKEARKAPDGYVQSLAGAGRAYNVYVHRCAPRDALPVKAHEHPVWAARG